jgi:diguanylate cyclase (GGDEF)-like protein
MVFGTVIAAMALVTVLSVWTAKNVDADAIARQVGFVRKGIDEIYRRLPVEQESVVIWDDAVLQTRANNQAWLPDNLGEWMGSYFGHDRVFILDDHDVPMHAMINEETVDSAAYHEVESVIGPLVDRLRETMAKESAGLDDSAEALLALGTEDYVLLGGSLAIVSVKPILPSTEAVSIAPGTEYLHIAIQNIDENFLAEITEKYELDGLRLLPPGSEVSDDTVVAIADTNNRILGLATWNGDRPGTRVLMQLAPTAVIAFAAGIAVLGWLLIRLGKSSVRLHASEAQAHFLAFHDALTGLPNRALFEDRLDRALLPTRQGRGMVALHAIDIDRFKHINDTLGHPAGDELIQQVGQRLTRLIAASDTVARLGGDEFAIIQVGVTTDREAEELAQRVVDVLGSPYELRGEPAFVGASVGLVLAGKTDVSRDEMLRKADIALYEAKAQGRGRFQLFAGDMDEIVKRRRLVEQELRTALETGTQLKVVYQPLYEASGRTILGAEALVRWDHPVHGRLSPELFIGIAEERALIEPLGEWVLRQACEMAVRADLPWIAVNVSPIQFRSPGFPLKVMHILGETGLSPPRLQLEITEGVLLESTGLVEESLNRLRESGVRIALDDFGTGYSSMSYLRRYKVDKLKIDRSFVAQLGQSQDSDAIVRAMVSLARALRLEVTAEGIETQEQQDHLAAIGCNEFQGFLFSRPIDEQQLTALLHGHPLARSILKTAR